MKGKMIASVSVLKELLGKATVIEDIQISDQSERGFTVILKERGNGITPIDVICLKRAVPSSVKEAVQAVSQSDGQAYRIIMAPYISDASAKICEISGAGYCDLSGNCLIQTDRIYISNKGNPNQYPAENHAKTIFKSSAKITSLILRELMKNVSKGWKIKELAEEVGCSIGMVSRAMLSSHFEKIPSRIPAISEPAVQRILSFFDFCPGLRISFNFSMFKKDHPFCLTTQTESP